MLQAETKLETEVAFGGAKVGRDLLRINFNTVLSHVCPNIASQSKDNSHRPPPWKL